MLVTPNPTRDLTQRGDESSSMASAAILSVYSRAPVEDRSYPWGAHVRSCIFRQNE